ncbi:MAG: class I SAM-dependent methyltransferase, partial [Pseudomonadota bacterium]
EFSHPITEGFDHLYRLYSDTVIPRLGAVVTGDRDSYHYLVESIKRFPPQDAFLMEIEKAGFVRTGYENLTGGIVALHGGWKI